MGEPSATPQPLVGLAVTLLLAGCTTVTSPSPSATSTAAPAPSLAIATSTPIATPPGIGWVGKMTAPRTGHTASLLADGRVLLVGGWVDSGPLASAEIYNPTTGMFSSTGSMSHAREGYMATPLADGRVLITGGHISAAEAGLPTPSPAPDEEEVEGPPPVWLDSAEMYDPAAGAFSPTRSMTTPRSGHSATLLADGRVLITGGDVSDEGSSTVSAEIYDPTTGRFSPTGSMMAARSGHAATLLASGRVLITGGDPTGYLAEVYDPTTGTFAKTGSLTTLHEDQTATVLADGRVLVAGGSLGVGTFEASPRPAEIYDPATGTFRPTGTMQSGRVSYTATLLPSGHVLFAGGCSTCINDEVVPEAEIYDPTMGTFDETASHFVPRLDHTATLLRDGRVLLAGGSDASGNGAPLAEAELYLPDTGTFSRWPARPSPSPAVSTLAPSPIATPATQPVPTASPTGSMTTVRSGHSATLLADGRVLIAGGNDCVKEEPFEWGGWVECSPLASAEIYDPATRTFIPTGSMTTVRGGHSAMLLADGRVLLVTVTASGDSGSIILAETYDPAKGTFSPAPGPGITGHGSPTLTPLADGRVLASGGSDYSYSDELQTESSRSVASAGVYEPKTGAFLPTGKLKSARVGHTATLLRDGRVLIAGGNTGMDEAGVSVTLASAEIYSPRTGTFKVTGKMRTARFGFTATLLRDGRVLIAGGCIQCFGDTSLRAAEIYNPRTGTFTRTGSMRTGRAFAGGVLLADGRVLIIGGITTFGEDAHDPPVASAEVYDPRTGIFSRTGSMTTLRDGSANTLLRDGRVLVTGGDASTDPEDEGPDIVASAEIYDPKTGTFSLTGP